MFIRLSMPAFAACGEAFSICSEAVTSSLHSFNLIALKVDHAANGFSSAVGPYTDGTD